MKFFLFLVFALSATMANAQQCNQHALMKPGTELEYKVSLPINPRNPVELHVLLTVSGVKDSTGTMYSEIIKKGGGNKNEKDRYSRQITLECDGKNLKIPFDLYTPDTVFMSEIYKPKASRGFYAANEPIKDDFFSYLVPLSLEGVTELPESGVKVVKQKTTVRDFNQGPSWEVAGAPSQSQAGIIRNTVEYYWKILKIKVAGKEKITTPAGTFDCYKIMADCEMEFGRTIKATLIMYFNNEVGLVKSRAQSQFPMAETELVKVKK
jgi:hypothetical protein